MKLYRKKPVVVEAIQLVDDASAQAIAEWAREDAEMMRVEDTNGHTVQVVIRTLEGDMIAALGDYVIKGVSGEFYPCKPDIFAATYEELL